VRHGGVVLLCPASINNDKVQHVHDEARVTTHSQGWILEDVH
jgi:ATP-dependent Clp protease adapter protein ClpS